MRVIAPQSGPSSADTVLGLVRDICGILETERATLAEAQGRVLREPVLAPEDQPPFDRSAVDGYAIRLEDHSIRFRVVDEIRAGDWRPRALLPGEAVRIATGGALPGDGLQVVMREDVERTGDSVAIHAREEDRHIRFRGEDARVGQVLVAEGNVLQPGALALLASVGCARPLVTRRPRVVHAATGNEIVPPEQTPGHGQIRDSNSTLVRAFLAAWQIEPKQLRVPEDQAAAQKALETSVGEANVLLVSGGASVGEHDFTRGLLESFGYAIVVKKTTLRPGKPLIVGQRGNAIAFGLPGNPLAHFVCLNLFVRAALAGYSGGAGAAEFQPGTLDADLPADGSSRETFWPARWKLGAGGAILTPMRWKSSGDLTSLAAANALVRVAAGADQLRPGHPVQYIQTQTSL